MGAPPPNPRSGLLVPLGIALSACSGAEVAAARPEPPPVEIPPRDEPAPPPDPACSSDADCGFDPARDRCRNDPRANRQPPLRDQGIVCYCEERARSCSTLRVPPVPCESDASCAVRLSPRPHPVAATVAHPHERGRPCRDFLFSTTCERTNICTMHRHACGPR
jgi:hypothetical protein